MASSAAARPKASRQASGHPGGHPNRFWALTLGAIGVVYGDIGTSPIYAFKEAATAATGETQVTAATVLGILSLIIWSLLLLVTLKYVFVLLRADNGGEGGTFALMVLSQSASERYRSVVLLLGICGAAFLYGDLALTPALSVVSAIEGLAVIAPAFEALVVPIAMLILIALFAVQRKGTGKVGTIFGPLLLVWFLALAVAGIVRIVEQPAVLAAFNPLHGLSFLLHNGVVGFTVLGLVFLSVTGAETLYADLGHFGRVPVQTAWLSVVLPALTLNYLGQGALVLSHPVAIQNPFFLMFPEWSRWLAVLLAAAATVTASQAVIAGAYSLTRQAVQLGLLPRLGILHTSEEMAGQIYLPRVNWLLLAAVLLLVLMFRQSSGLASAYGVAVIGTMITTSLMAVFVLRLSWRWPLWKVALLVAPILIIEVAFLSANAFKFLQGAWVPITCAAFIVTAMLTWRRGSAILAAVERANADVTSVLNNLERKPPLRVSGTAVFLTATPEAAPSSLLHNLKHNHMLHERNILLTVKSANVPRVPNSERVRIEPLSETFTSVTLTYGFMETPDVMKGLTLCRHRGLNIDPPATSFFLSRRTLRPTPKSKMNRLQEKLFIWLARSAENATTYFQIPPDRVVEIGTQIAV